MPEKRTKEFSLNYNLSQESASSISRKSLCIMTRPSFFMSYQNCLASSLMCMMGGNKRKSWPNLRVLGPKLDLTQSDRASCSWSCRWDTHSPTSATTSAIEKEDTCFLSGFRNTRSAAKIVRDHYKLAYALVLLHCKMVYFMLQGGNNSLMLSQCNMANTLWHSHNTSWQATTDALTMLSYWKMTKTVALTNTDALTVQDDKHT